MPGATDTAIWDTLWPKAPRRKMMSPKPSPVPWSMRCSCRKTRRGENRRDAVKWHSLKAAGSCDAGGYWASNPVRRTCHLSITLSAEAGTTSGVDCRHRRRCPADRCVPAIRRGRIVSCRLGARSDRRLRDDSAPRMALGSPAIGGGQAHPGRRSFSYLDRCGLVRHSPQGAGREQEVLPPGPAPEPRR